MGHLSDTASGKTLTLSKAAAQAFDEGITAIPFGLTAQYCDTVTATDNGDGTATVNGTIEIDTDFDWGQPTAVFSAGTYSISYKGSSLADVTVEIFDLDGKHIDESRSFWDDSYTYTFSVDKDFVAKSHIYVSGDSTFDNVVISYPTICAGSEAKPLFSTLKNTKPNWTITEL